MSKQIDHDVIKDAVLNYIVKPSDAYLSGIGFKRIRNSFKQIRKFKDSTQTIAVIISYPRYSDDKSVAHIQARYHLVMPQIDAVLSEMDRERFFSITSDIMENIGNLRARPEYWEMRPYGISEQEYAPIETSMSEILVNDVVPFLDDYYSPESLVEGHLKKDPRLPRGSDWLVHVAAAYVVLGEKNKAKEILETAFMDKLGLKKQFCRVLQYLGAA